MKDLWSKGKNSEVAWLLLRCYNMKRRICQNDKKNITLEFLYIILWEIKNDKIHKFFTSISFVGKNFNLFVNTTPIVNYRELIYITKIIESKKLLNSMSRQAFQRVANSGYEEGGGHRRQKAFITKDNKVTNIITSKSFSWKYTHLSISNWSTTNPKQVFCVENTVCKLLLWWIWLYVF